MFRKKLIHFSVLNLTTIIAAAILVLISVRLTQGQISQVNMAQQLLNEHLQLSSTSYRLFKQLTDEILIGEFANQAEVRNKRAMIAESLGRIRVLEVQQREALGAEFTRGSIEDTDDLERLIDAIIYEFEDLSRATPSDANNEQVRFILEERIDIAFREAINTAVNRQSNVVDTLNDRIENIHMLVFWATFTLAALAVLFAVVRTSGLMRSLSRPVAALTEATNRIAKGDFSHRVPRGFDAEFDQIAAAFNLMTDQLASQAKSREQTQQELEYMVAKRTAELTEANTELEKSAMVKRNFLADISHELRTPLTIIRGEAQVALRRDDRDSDEYRDALSCVLEQSVALSRLVDDLLFIARADSNNLRLSREHVDLAQLAEDIARDLQHSAKSGQTINVSHQGNTGIAADSERLRQLIVILTENALRYAPEATAVTLDIRAEGHTVELNVIDQGPGIAADDLPFVFDRFYRGQQGKTDDQGLGLGLAVAKAIVNAHEGQIEALSESGHGTTMRVRLPRS